MAKCFIVSAPSGTGKTSLVKALLDSLDNIAVSISHTTRAMRPGEINGLNYHFIDESTFQTMLDNDEFFEYAEVYGHRYGTSKKEVELRLQKGQDVILEIEWQGAEQVRKIFSGVVSIFILPPNKNALLERLRLRGQDSDDVINARFAKAANEIKHQANYDYIVVNDQFEVALSDLRSIIRAEHCRQSDQVKKYDTLLKSLMQY